MQFKVYLKVSQNQIHGKTFFTVSLSAAEEQRGAFGEPPGPQPASPARCRGLPSSITGGRVEGRRRAVAGSPRRPPPELTGHPPCCWTRSRTVQRPLLSSPGPPALRPLTQDGAETRTEPGVSNRRHGPTYGRVTRVDLQY